VVYPGKTGSPPPTLAPATAVSPPPTPPVPKSVAPQDQVTVDTCKRDAMGIQAFMRELNGRDYIKSYDLPEGISRHLNQIAIKLLNNPPIITDDSTDMYTILKNSAHLYHILGPKDISLLKDIITYESEGVENILAVLYSWSTNEPPCEHQHIGFSFPLEKRTIYAAFFLKTTAGAAYLKRRDPRLRALVEYYAYLTLREAASIGADIHRVDLDATRTRIREDLLAADFLLFKSDYLQQLGGETTRQ